MVLTPDQKRRLAELNVEAPAKKEEEEAKPLSGRLKALWFTARTSRLTKAVTKVLFVCVAVGVAGYFVVDYQLHRIDFKAAFSSGRGSPMHRLWRSVKVQKHKADMLDEGHAQFLVGDYKAALATAVAVSQMDPEDTRARNLIDLAADAATQRANRKFDAGEIEAALADARLALKHRPEHKDAQELLLRIGERLLTEAQVHYRKMEYSQLITKAREVIKINPSDMRASNLLIRTNNGLLARADELFISKRYYDALENVRLSLRIDPTNARARRLLNQISLYIETPALKLRGINMLGRTLYAIIQLPHTNQPVYVKEGDTVKNFRVVDIDAEARTVKLLQIYTRHEFTIDMPKPE